MSNQDLIQAEDKSTNQPSPGVSESKSKYQLLEDSKKIKIKPSKKNNNQLLKKRFNLLEERIFSQGSLVNEKSAQSALQYLIQDLKSELIGQSSLDSLDHPAQRLLNQTKFFLNKSDKSEKQLREDSKKIKKILIQYQEEKLHFYFEQKNSKRLLKRLDLIEGYLSKIHNLNQGKDPALCSLRKSLKTDQASQS